MATQERVGKPADTDIPPQVTETPSDAEIVSLFPKRRGRPKRAPVLARPCPDKFETIALAISGLPSKDRPRLKERVWSNLARAAKRNELPNYAVSVMTVHLESINWKSGYDFWGIDRIADEAEVHRQSVIKAHKLLEASGLIKREVIDHVTGGKPGANKKSRTTIPALLEAYRELREEREAKKVAGTTPKKYRKVAKKYQEGSQQMGEDGSSDGYPNHRLKPIEPDTQSERTDGAPADNYKSDFEKRRFDKALPLKNRVAHWKWVNLAELSGADQQLHARWERAIRILNWDRFLILESFCRHYQSNRTHDAQLELVKYVERRLARGHQHDQEDA